MCVSAIKKGDEKKMKKIRNLALLLITFAVFYAGQAQAQTPIRIQFAKGRNSAVVQGITGTNGIYYNVRAKSGQKVLLVLTPKSTVGIKVERNGANGHEVLLREEKGGT